MPDPDLGLTIFAVAALLALATVAFVVERRTRRRSRHPSRKEPAPAGEISERQRTERSLRLLEQAVTTMSIGVTVTDMEGRILLVNPAAARMHGYRVDELMGQSSALFAPRGQRAPLKWEPGGEKLWERERRDVRRDGTEFPVRLLSSLVTDPEGERLGLVTLCEDISERLASRAAIERRDQILEAVGLAAERFLAESALEEGVDEVLAGLGRATGVDRVYLRPVEEGAGRFRMLQDHDWVSPYSRLGQPRWGSGKVSFDRGRFPRWRTRLAAGHTVQDRVSDLPQEEKAELLSRGVRAAVLVPISVEGTWWGFLCLEEAESGRVWSNAELEALRTAARTLGAAIGRRWAVGALAASQESYRDLLENAHDLIQSVSPSGRFHYVNRAWREALGYSEAEVARLRMDDILHPEDRRRYREVLSRIQAGEDVGPVEAVFVTKKGAGIAVEGSLDCRFIKGKTFAVRGIFRDISERAAVDRMKQEFISTVSHELRTPLTSIIASLDLLAATEDLDPGEHEELLAMARRNSERLERLIGDLLDLSKLVARKMEFKIERLEASAVLAEAAQAIEAFADSYGIRLEVDAPPPSVEVLADRDRLMQVMANLLSNAIKFSPEGDGVTLAASQQGDRVVFSVMDRGPGIPEEFRRRLYDKFSQAEPSGSGRQAGSGLGLSIVKALVEGMSGRVALDTAVAEGTKFDVYLPRAVVPPQ